MTKVEGFIPVEGGNVWYKIAGTPQSIPLILLHGGPGWPHDYLEPLENLATNRQVIFYDQLGCGNSDKTANPALWTVEQFVKELHQVIKAVKLETYHILGHSWGSAIAVAFALTKPEGLTSLIFSDPYISSPLWMKDAERLIKLLPENMQAALISGNVESGEYEMASKE
ncbi:MAG: alpha/beta fold hydrolase [Candidatus Liptonbacteria bacterium]|nr:alpha/beta fold hydrolase [Candidatus Liptonbacteria bacterium]